jgi:hypothetical protein
MVMYICNCEVTEKGERGSSWKYIGPNYKRTFTF